MDRYSRIISLLKVILPLAALGLLSTVFLISERITTDPAMPFEPKEIESRIAGQQITAPYYAGTTTAGHEITISAKRASPGLPDQENAAHSAQANDLQAQIRMADGKRILLLANSGTLEPGGDNATMSGDVRIIAPSNMTVSTEQLHARLEQLDIRAPAKVTASADFGTLNAGAMRIFTKTKKGPAHIVFTGGVKVIYDPGNVER